MYACDVCVFVCVCVCVCVCVFLQPSAFAAPGSASRVKKQEVARQHAQGSYGLFHEVLGTRPHSPPCLSCFSVWVRNVFMVIQRQQQHTQRIKIRFFYFYFFYCFLSPILRFVFRALSQHCSPDLPVIEPLGPQILATFSFSPGRSTMHMDVLVLVCLAFGLAASSLLIFFFATR